MIKINPFYDYIPLLIKTMETIKPKTVLEYGTGISTILLCKLYPETRVTTIEYSLKWFLINKIVSILRGCRNLKLVYVPSMKRFIRYAKELPVQDLYFLDAPESYEDRKVILRGLKEFGKPILVHDSQHIIKTLKRCVLVR